MYKFLRVIEKVFCRSFNLGLAFFYVQFHTGKLGILYIFESTLRTPNTQNSKSHPFSKDRPLLFFEQKMDAEILQKNNVEINFIWELYYNTYLYKGRNFKIRHIALPVYS